MNCDSCFISSHRRLACSSSPASIASIARSIVGRESCSSSSSLNHRSAIARSSDRGGSGYGGRYAARSVSADELRPVLRAAAEEHYGRPVEIDGPRPLLGGPARGLWALDARVPPARHPLVLRRDPPGVEDPAARAREAEALAAASRHGVPVPVRRGVQDGGGMVMQRLEGEAIARRILRDERNATARGRLVDDVARSA